MEWKILKKVTKIIKFSRWFSIIHEICFLFKTVNNNKRKREDFKFGNYRNYYFKRLGEQPSDFRIDLLEAHPEYFRNKTVLDIGCNSGFVTINIAKKLLPASVLGVDIDGSLIEEARRCLEKEKTAECSEEERSALSHVVFKKVRSKSFA